MLGFFYFPNGNRPAWSLGPKWIWTYILIRS